MRKIKLAENIRFYRKAFDLSQEQLADMLNVDKKTISAWENNLREPNIIIISKLCDIFGETADSLLFE